jgi:hypothetical protein
MSATTEQKDAITPGQSRVREGFSWSASTPRGSIRIVRAARSSPVFIQANN